MGGSRDPEEGQAPGDTGRERNEEGVDEDASGILSQGEQKYHSLKGMENRI